MLLMVLPLMGPLAGFYNLMIRWLLHARKCAAPSVAQCCPGVPAAGLRCGTGVICVVQGQ